MVASLEVIRDYKGLLMSVLNNRINLKESAIRIHFAVGKLTPNTIQLEGMKIGKIQLQINITDSKFNLYFV